MKKRIVSIILSVLMLISVVPISYVFAAEATNIIVTADKITAYPDDVVNFSISIGSVEHLMGAEFKVTIPTGMTYVTGSAFVADGLKATLGCASADWTESSMKFTMYGDGDYSSNDNTKILTFSCRINSNVSDSIAPQITDIVLSNTEFEEILTQVTDDAGTVSVKAKPVAATSVSLNKTTLSLNTGACETLIATVSPDNATNKNVTWKSSNTSVAAVDNSGKVTAIKKGTATITVTTADGSFTDACSVSVACSHSNTTVHPAKTSTCLVQGNNEYTTCDDCYIVVSGSDAKLPFADHTYVEKAEAQYLKSTATCISKAVYYKNCSECGIAGTETFEYGEFDMNNHVGATYIKDQKEATCYEDGYTGDTYCSDCNVKIKDGTVIEKSSHNPASVWSTDDNYHWKTCQTVGCGNIIDKAEHSGGTADCSHKAICEVCGVEYGVIDADNHINTEICNAVEVSCTQDGYTGDIYCKDCGEKVTDGTVIKAGHDYGDSYKSDAENHWKECGCGNVTDKSAHTFGEWSVIKAATETEKGNKEKACSVCGYKVTEDIPVLPVENNTDNNEAENPTDKPTTTINKNDRVESPETGAENNTVMYIALLGISGIALIGTTIRRKKRAK